MGNFEKLVVLTVLFLSIIVLAVSLHGGDDAAKKKSGPLTAAKERVESATQSSQAAEARGKGEKTPALLSSEVASSAPATEAPARNAAGKPRVLVASQGLTPSAFSDYMEYIASSGDTWPALAERFYADAHGMELLRAANEELLAPVAGAKLLVPVFDFGSASPTRTPFAPAPALRAPEGSGLAVDANVAKPTMPATNPGGTQAIEAAQDVAKLTEYVVQNGDNLSKIAKKVYGSANRWQEIYKANQGVLEGPDWLQVGMKLEIPR